jgi:hypothetical protein
LFSNQIKDTNLLVKRNITNLDINKLRDKSSLIGGKWTPLDCVPKFKTAIIIPLRNEQIESENHMTFIYHMHSFLRKQKLNYGIYFMSIDAADVEMAFNKGILANTGFREALAEQNFDCFIFHDMDMVPINEQNLYECNLEKPIRLASYTSLKMSKEYALLIIN